MCATSMTAPTRATRSGNIADEGYVRATSTTTRDMCVQHRRRRVICARNSDDDGVAPCGRSNMGVVYCRPRSSSSPKFT